MSLPVIHPPTRGLSRRSRRSRNTLLWGLAAFALLQGLMTLAMFKWPVLRDPEPGVKGSMLARRQAEKARSSPLVLALGSSRMAMGFRPELVSVSRRKSKKLPLVFNFGLTQMIPIRQLMALQTLLANGVRPREVLLEYYPDFLSQPVDHVYSVYDIQRASPADMNVLRQFCPVPYETNMDWWRGQLLPAYYHRRLYLNYTLPAWVEPEHQNFWPWKGITDHGWLKLPNCDLAISRNLVLEDLRRNEHERTRLEWNLNPDVEKVFRRMLDLCREHKVKVTLVMLPEYGPLWGHFSRQSMRLQDEYLDRIMREYSLPVVDARDWLGDDCMSDVAHATHEGATLFTERFCREYLEKALDGVHASESPNSTGHFTEPLRVIGESPSLTWGRGFSQREGSGALVWRWAEAEGRLHLRARTRRRVELKFSVDTGHAEPARLEVQSSLFPLKTTAVNNRTVEWVERFEMPVGEHTLTFRCSARRVDAPSDPRVMIFRISHPEVNYAE